MPTTLISAGYPQTLLSGVTYALPTIPCEWFAQGAGTIQISNDGTTWAAPAANALLNGAFVRSNAGDAILNLKPYR